MLKAIRKFVFERRRDIRQEQLPVVEEPSSSDPSNRSEVASEAARPQSEETSEMSVRAKVKWFNPAKRFGFVELADGSGDAFLHLTVLSRLGISTLQPGETLELRVASGERGPVVTEVIDVDSSTAVARKPSRASFAPPDDQGVRLHRSGWRREGYFRPRLRAPAGWHHKPRRRPARGSWHRGGSKGTGSWIDTADLAEVAEKASAFRLSPDVHDRSLMSR